MTEKPQNHPPPCCCWEKANQELAAAIGVARSMGVNKAQAPAVAISMIRATMEGRDILEVIQEHLAALTPSPRKAVESFLADCCELGDDYWVGCSDLFHSYKAWCSSQEVKTLSKRQFYQTAIEQAGVRQARKRLSPDNSAGSRLAAFVGIRIKGKPTSGPAGS